MGRDRLNEISETNPFGLPQTQNVNPQMSDFFSKSQECKELLSNMESKIEMVKKLQKQILTSSDDDDETRERLNQVMSEIKNVASRAKDLLKSMADETKNAESENATSTEFRIKKTQHFASSNQFIDLMNVYNGIQIDYREKCKRQIQRQLQITGVSVDNDKLDEMINSGNPKVFTQGIVVDRDQIQLNAVIARQNEILGLEKSINEMTDIFTDIALLIETQGQIIDDIRFNVENAKDFTEKANENTRRAVAYQTSARRKKICCFFVLFIVIGVVITIVVLVTKKKK